MTHIPYGYHPASGKNGPRDCLSPRFENPSGVCCFPFSVLLLTHLSPSLGRPHFSKAHSLLLTRLRYTTARLQVFLFWSFLFKTESGGCLVFIYIIYFRAIRSQYGDCAVPELPISCYCVLVEHWYILSGSAKDSNTFYV